MKYKIARCRSCGDVRVVMADWKKFKCLTCKKQNELDKCIVLSETNEPYHAVQMCSEWKKRIGEKLGSRKYPKS